LPPSVVAIDANAFKGCAGITNLTLSTNLQVINSSAFQGATGISTLNIPSSVISIGANAFNGCTGITNLVLSENLQNISSGAFQGTTGIKNLYIPTSVHTIGTNAFYGSSSLTNISVNDASSLFSSLEGNLLTKDKKGLILVPGGKSGKIFLKSPIERIESGSFSGCSMVTKIYLNENIHQILEDPFSGCAGLTAIYFKGNAPSILSNTFGSIPQVSIFYMAGATGWQNLAGSNPNIQEWKPLQPKADFVVDFATRKATLQFPTEISFLYEIEKSMDLVNWEKVVLGIDGDDQIAAYETTLAQSKVFYRILRK